MYNIARYVGIELEICEKWHTYDKPSKGHYWYKKYDGSVSSDDFGGYGAEFVFDKPLIGKDVVESVTNICHWFKARQYSSSLMVKRNTYAMIPEHYFMTATDVNAGFHLHLDYRGVSDAAALNFADVAYTIQPNIIKTVHRSRQDNGYCVLYDNYPSHDYIYNNRCWEDCSRYNWINITNLRHREERTIEIRLHEGTTDKDKILTWCEFWTVLANLCDNNRVTPEFVRSVGFKGLLERMKLSPKTRERFALCV